MQPGTALCGHLCDPYQPRNSVLDQIGDVVLFRDCDGTRHLFRGGHADGLILTSTGAGWVLTRERHVEVAPDRWAMVVDDQPVCTGLSDGDDWIVQHRTGRTVVRADTLYGALARATRFYLRTTG